MAKQRFQVIIDVIVYNPDGVMEQARNKIIAAECQKELNDLDLPRAIGWLFDLGLSKFNYNLEIEYSPIVCPKRSNNGPR